MYNLKDLYDAGMFLSVVGLLVIGLLILIQWNGWFK